MAYAHARGAAHGRLDADCVLVGDFREVQIVGWEGARELRAGTRSRRTRATTSTPWVVCSHPSSWRARSDPGRVARPWTRRSAATAQDEILARLAVECLDEDDAVRPPDARPVAERLSRRLSEMEARAQRARVEAFEARARFRRARLEAAADRRARRRQRLILAVVLVTLLGGGWAWSAIRAGETARAEATDREVGERVDRARRLRQEGAVREAAVEARTAFDLAKTRAATPSVAERARTLAADLEAEVRDLDAEVRLQLSNRALLDRLREIEVRRHEGNGIEETVAAARGVLSEHGLDPYEVGPIAAVEGLAARGPEVAGEVSRLYDAWAVNLGLQGPIEGEPELPDWRVLAETAAGIATDPVRDVVRTFLATRDYATVLEEAASIDPGSVPAYSLALLAGEIVSSPLHAEEAADLLRRATLYHPDDFWIHWQLAEYVAATNGPESFLHYEAALAAVPQSPMALGGVAFYYLMQGQSERALDFADRALAARPDRRAPRALIVKGRLAAAGGDRETAISLYREATRVLPRWAYGWHTLGVALRLAGRLEESIPAFAKAAEIRHDDSGRVATYALTLDEAGRSREAEQVLRRHIAEEAATAEAWILLAMIVCKQDRWEDAIAVLRDGLARWPRVADLHSDLAYYLALAPGSARDPEAAAHHAATSLELAPSTPNTRGILGILAYRDGDFETAVASLRQAIALYRQPGAVPANEDRLWLAMALHALGRTEEAESEWRAAQAWRAGQTSVPWFFDRVAAEAAQLFR